MSCHSSWLRRWYGSGPTHLIVLSLGGAVGLYAAVKLVRADPVGVIVWLVAGALLHDAVLVPAYTAFDRVTRRAIGPGSPPWWWNHIRVPAMLSALLFLVFFPLILGKPHSFDRITGTPLELYPGRYLRTVAMLFAISGLAALIRVGLHSRSRI